MKAVITQTRLLYPRLYHKGKVVVLDVHGSTACGLNVMTSLEHLLFSCQSLTVLRENCPLIMSSPSMSHFVTSVKNTNCDLVRSVFYFIIGTIRKCCIELTNPC